MIGRQSCGGDPGSFSYVVRFVAVAIIAACSSSSTGGTPVIPHAPVPEVTNNGGPILAAPKLVAITFDGDPLRGKIEDFVQTIPSAYWSRLTEYGVGPITGSSSIHVSKPAPASADDAAIQAFLGTLLDAPDASAVYAVFYPGGTTLSGPAGAVGCVSIGGWHQSLPSRIAYAVIARCADDSPLARVGPKGIDQVTVSASHEIVEAVTDPFAADPAFVGIEGKNPGYEDFLGGALELADYCATDIDFDEARRNGFPYLLSPFWSNKAAAGHAPCVPSAGAYFNAATSVNPIRAPVGQPVTVEVDLFSDAPTGGPWTVVAHDYQVLLGKPPLLTFQLEETTGQAGDKLRMTVTATGSYVVEPFLLVSTLNGSQHYWIGEAAP